MTSTAKVAYLAEGKLFLLEPGQASPSPRLIESPFAQGLIDRATRDRQRNDWKSKAAGWQVRASGGMFGMMDGAPPADVRRIRITSVARGAAAGELLYSMDTDYVSGLFAYDLAENHERRLFHRNQFRGSDLARHPADGTLAMSQGHEDGSANLAIMEASGRGLKQITEGDSVDEAPAWVEGGGKALVFQSAGIGRNDTGFRVALGSYAVQKLDLDKNEFVTLLESDEHDYLTPRMRADGTLYYIRRPYQPHGQPVSPWKVALDVVLFPFRLVIAILHFLNFFALMFSRKPLMTAGGPPKEGPDSRYLMLWGKVIDAETALRQSRKGGGDGTALVPRTWELIRRSPEGEETVLASAVLAFDLGADGQIVYTNGSAIRRLSPDGKDETLFTGRMIERVSVVG